MTAKMGYSVIIAVRNEVDVLSRTVPKLLAATAGDSADIIYVCNGCTDRSAALIVSLAGDRVRVFETDVAGKTHAYNLGDSATEAFPRFYVDADISLGIGDLSRLASALISQDVDLIAPCLRYEMLSASAGSRAIAKIWQELPHGKTTTFQGVIGLSEKARTRWTRFPTVSGDDIFIQAKVADLPRMILPSIQAQTDAPRTVWAWVRMRARWRRGEIQLARLGYTYPRPQGQKMALLSLVFCRQTAFGAILFLAVRLLAELIARLSQHEELGWSPDPRL